MADKKQKILIVDDSEMNRDILAVMLGSDYEILEAENGLEAIEILQQGMTDIDLILLDIMMPEMDGFDVLGFMKRSHMTEVIPVIMISSESSSSYIEKAYEMGAADYISRPFNALIVGRRVINTLMLYAKQKRLVQMVADQVYEREKNNDMMVNILSHIVEFRNGESGQHVRHIHMMTEILLQHLQKRITKYQITQEDIVRIATASALHDIGKISIPDTILNKPGKLTKEEYEIVKTHSMAGAQMLDALPEYKDTPFVKTAYEICRWHHERYDGKGYPDGLNGEEIPAQRCQLTKIEFVDSKIYLVISHYVEIDGKGYALEMVTEIRDELLFGAYGRSELIEKIEQYNNKIYRDPLSGAFNRRYYEEQACHMVYMDGVAMIDADDFKEINDKYGHMVGDLALKAYTEGVFSVIRSTDILIRYGGDEFVLLINHVLKDVFIDKLERICKAVSAKKVEGYPQIQLSVSIGGVYKGGPVKTAIVLADSEMYKIKKLKNSVSVYEGGE